MLLNIVKEGHPILRKIAVDVDVPLKSEDKTTIKKMIEYLKLSQIPEFQERFNLRAGVGLSAPQISISKRMFVIYLHDGTKLLQYVFINPEIVSVSDKLIYLPSGEGCLSIVRDVEGVVLRHQQIIVKTKLYNPNTELLKSVKIQLKDYLAIVFQHEYDHLNGILFPDKIADDTSNAIPFELFEKSK